MRLTLDLNTRDGYRTFLRVKSLPVYSFTGREASFPDEYHATALRNLAKAEREVARTVTGSLFAGVV